MAKAAKKDAQPAKGKAAQTAGKKKAQKKGLSSTQTVFLILMLILTLLFFPYALIFWVGMTPTIVSFITDPDHDPAAPITLGALNICGVVPVLFALWRAEASLNDAINILSDPFNLLMMFGAASVGWVVWTLVPRFYATAASANAQKRLNALKKARDAIIDEWGADITMSQLKD